MLENNPILYIDCRDWKEFLDYQKDHQDRYECIYIADETFLRGRTPGLIRRVGRYQDRWNEAAITEMIDRAYLDWADFFQRAELDQELRESGLSEEDTQYGIHD